MTRRITRLGVAAVMAGMLAACGGGDDDSPLAGGGETITSPSTTGSTSTTRPVEDRETSEALFRAGLEVSGDPALVDADDAAVTELIAFADETCAVFDRGGTYEEIQTAILTADPVYAEQMGYVIGSGVTAFCPEHSGQLP